MLTSMTFNGYSGRNSRPEFHALRLFYQVQEQVSTKVVDQIWDIEYPILGNVLMEQFIEFIGHYYANTA